MLPFVFALDFEGDQWTFFKPQLADLRTLYGIDVQEMTLWRPLLDHALEHLGVGKLLSVEANSWWLPDTAGTDYRSAHGKTTIVINDVDTDARSLGYFHNGSYFNLTGEDFDKTFWLTGGAPILPPYAELIHIDRAVARDPDTLRMLSRDLLTSILAGDRPAIRSSDSGCDSRRTWPSCTPPECRRIINGHLPVCANWARPRTSLPNTCAGNGRTLRRPMPSRRSSALRTSRRS